METITGYNKQICWPQAHTSRRQAPLRHSRETGPVPSLSPLSPTRLQAAYAWERGCIFPQTLCLIAPSSVTQKVKSCSYPSVAGGLTDRGVFVPTAVSGKVIYIPLETQTSLLPQQKCPWLQISSCQEVGNYSVLCGSLSPPSELPLLLLTK